MYAREDRPIRDPGGRLGLAALGQFGLTWLAGGETGLEKAKDPGRHPRFVRSAPDFV